MNGASTLQRLTVALADRYRVDRELGAGGMATVYLAHDLRHERDVAIKVLHPDLGAALGADRFLAEIKTTAKLQHPHILPLLDSGAADGLLYYVMPFVKGETLRDRLTRSGALPVQEAVPLLCEIADALAYAHQHGVVHRDVKPENVLLGSGHALVADFGIAKAARSSGQLTGTGMSLGTPAYMAPEQAAGDPATDHRADVYAWGIVAYELLTGAPPFTGSPQQVMAAHFSQSAPDLHAARAHVPPALADLVAQCLRKDAAQRPETAQRLVIALDAMRTSGTPTVTPRRRPTRLAMAVVAGAVLLTLAVRYFAARPSNGDGEAIVSAGAERIAVLPLNAVSDTALERLGRDLVVTLSTTMDGVGSLRMLDAGTVLVRARTLSMPIPIADARALGKELGAASVITGALTRESDKVRATVNLSRVAGDSVLATATATSAPADVATLSDSLAWQLLRQVWQRGEPPSPVLAGLTTSSFAALRAFLDGEQLFRLVDYVGATKAYRQAFETDTLFAQAYLRYHLARYWSLEERDEVVWKRIQATASRLPKREREWLDVEAAQVSAPERLRRWRELAARYPDYPPAVMAAGDLIVHLGGWYGIPMSEAMPYFERFTVLNPSHADAWSHLQFTEWFSDDPAVRLRTAEQGVHLKTDSTGSVWANAIVLLSSAFEAAARKQPIAMNANMRALARGVAQLGPSGGSAFYSGVLFSRFAPQREVAAALATFRKEGIYRGSIEDAVRFGEASSRAARGEWRAAMETVAPTERIASISPAMRLQPARLAVFGVFVGVLDTASAAAVVARAPAIAGLDAVSMAEALWLQGVMASMRGDDTGVAEASRQLRTRADGVAQHAARSLAGLWLSRRNLRAGADSLRALSDGVFKGEPFLETAEALDRFVFTRQMRQSGQAADVERYLRWAELLPSEARGMGSVIPLFPYVDYEWALALEASGEPVRAIRHYQSVVDNIDRPDPALVPIVQDAKRRLETLTGDARKAARK